MAERIHRAADLVKRMRARNLALFALLMGLVILFYVMTIVRLGGAGS